MLLTNAEMDGMIATLEPFLDRKDIIGFAAGRAVKRLTDSCGEYLKKKQELVMEYGKPVLDQEGNETGDWMLPADSEGFEEAAATLAEYATIKHSVDLPVIPITEALDNLTGREMLTISFLFADGEDSE